MTNASSEQLLLSPPECSIGSVPRSSIIVILKLTKSIANCHSCLLYKEHPKATKGGNGNAARSPFCPSLSLPADMVHQKPLIPFDLPHHTTLMPRFLNDTMRFHNIPQSTQASAIISPVSLIEGLPGLHIQVRTQLSNSLLSSATRSYLTTPASTIPAIAVSLRTGLSDLSGMTRTVLKALQYRRAGVVDA